MHLARSAASSGCLRFQILCCSVLLSDDASVALLSPSPVLPLRNFWSGFLMPCSEILTGAKPCFEGLFLFVRLFFSYEVA